jgi:hypothetical protein
MTIQLHRLILTTSVSVAVVAATAACGTDRGHFAEPTGRIGSGITGGADLGQTESAVPNQGRRDTATTANPTGTKASKSTTGDRPPVDPCSVSWADFPPAVRPPNPAAKGLPTAPRQDEPFIAACTYSNSTETGGSPDNPTGPGAFAARILWSVNLDTTKMAKGATVKTWGGHAGGLQSYGGKDGTGCLGYMAVGDGHVAVQLLNNRFPATESCAVVDGLMTGLSGKIR